MYPVTRRDPNNTCLTFAVEGNDKWGYYIRIYDPDEPPATISLVPNTPPPLDWSSPKEAAQKAVEVLRELADLIETTVAAR